MVNADGSSTCTVSVPAPIGADTFVVTTYDQAPSGLVPQGNILSTNTLPFTVVYGQVNTLLGLTLNGVPQQIELTPPGFLLPPNITSTFTFNVNATDADGDYIVGPGNYTNPITLTLANDPNHTLALSTASISSPATTAVTVTYNGGTLPGTATIVGSASGAVTSQPLTVQVSPGVTQVTIVEPAAEGSITEYATPTAGSNPAGIAAGPDGNLWFTENLGNKIGRLTPSGTFIEIPVPPTVISSNIYVANPVGIATGPDGNLWFTEQNANKIGSINPTTMTIVQYPIQTGSPGGLNAHLRDIVSGPDGNLWFTEYGASKIGRITTTGTVTEYSTPTSNSGPTGITVGTDGNLWFTEVAANKVASIFPSTGTIIEYTVPTSNAQPEGITSGPDGNLWFAETNGGNIGRITTNGSINEFAVGGQPAAITSDQGFLWFTDIRNEAIVGINPSGGGIVTYTIPTSYALPNAIVLGPDGNLWFIEEATNKIGKFVP